MKFPFYANFRKRDCNGNPFLEKANMNAESKAAGKKIAMESPTREVANAVVRDLP